MEINAEFKPFHHNQFGDIRATNYNGINWFVGIDVCNALGYKRANDAIRDHVETCDTNSTVIHRGINKRGNPNVIVINESGLYSLIMSSHLPAAQEFKHWVTSEVLPTLRTTGHYDMGIQNNETFNFVNKADDVFASNTPRTILANKVKQYADIAHIPTPYGWSNLYDCFKNKYGTDLIAKRHKYEKDNNLRRDSLSGPEFIERIGVMDNVIDTVDEMINSRYKCYSDGWQEQNNDHTDKLIEAYNKAHTDSCNAYATLCGTVANILNQKAIDSRARGEIAFSTKEIPKDIMHTLGFNPNNYTPFYVDINKMNVYITMNMNGNIPNNNQQ